MSVFLTLIPKTAAFKVQEQITSDPSVFRDVIKGYLVFVFLKDRKFFVFGWCIKMLLIQ